MTRGNKPNKIDIKMKRGTKPNTPTTYKPVQSPSYLPKRMINIDDISPEELIFAYEWANTPGNPLKALKASGLVGKKATRTEQEETLKGFMNSGPVQRAFKEAMFNRIEALQITTNRIDSHLAVMAFTDPGLAFNEDGTMKSITEMPWEVRTCIQDYEEKMYYPPKGDPYKKTKIKYYNAMDALKTLRTNKNEDKKLAMGFGNGSGKGDTFIQNNIIGSGNSYNQTVDKVLQIENLAENELDILLKAVGAPLKDDAIMVENLVNQVKAESEAVPA